MQRNTLRGTNPIPTRNPHSAATNTISNQIGLQHGTHAAVPIARTIAFYTWQFQTASHLAWPEVRSLALEFAPTILKKWPAYHAEMSGIAVGAGVQLADIIAINVRTEITFGLFSDGCTALAWKTGDGKGKEGSWLAQNWDWNPRQKENLVLLSISQPSTSLPRIKMVTEAGIIGKIGLNSAGVGVCLNAIKAKGMDPTKLPCHLGLRAVLESSSRAEAVAKLEKFGVASACHMLIADAETGGEGLEWSSKDVAKVKQNPKGQVFHSNHYLLPHTGGVEDVSWLEDSKFRVKRIQELCEGIQEGEVGWESLGGVFRDEKNFPGSICREAEGRSTSATLFNIVMELKGRKAEVRVGRPTEEGGEVVRLEF